MLNRIREKRYIKLHVKESVENLCNIINEIRKQSDVIAIAPKPTENSWQGVMTATLGLFPNCTFQLPQYFTHQIYSNNELSVICDFLLNAKFSKIIFSGYPLYFGELILYLNKKGFSNIYLIYHGSFSSNREDNVTTKMLLEIEKLQKENQIKRIGFVKKGLSETLHKVVGIESSHIILKTNIYNDINIQKFDSTKTHIGVFTHSAYRKNIDNQIAAGLMFDNAIVHTKNRYDYDYLMSQDRIIYHQYFAKYKDFISLLASMDVNMYVSFSECWGQVITESLSVGVPCLAADNAGVFDYNSELHDLLVVSEFDNSDAIFKKMQIVLTEKENIKQEMKDYVVVLNRMSDISLANFLST